MVCNSSCTVNVNVNVNNCGHTDSPPRVHGWFVVTFGRVLSWVAMPRLYRFLRVRTTYGAGYVL